jgi:hypothetical protein
MIDLQTENVIPLFDAPAHLPHRRGKQPIALSTLYRWAQPEKGYRGIVLETVKVGDTRCTSLEALQRFVDEISEATYRPYRKDTPKKRQRETEKAIEILKSQGM